MLHRAPQLRVGGRIGCGAGVVRCLLSDFNGKDQVQRMGEYQYVHFQTIDKPLDDAQLEFMQRQSSRAEVSRTEFTCEYHYSSFRGRTLEMMFKGYDIHLCWSSYGGKCLMFRLPGGLPWNPRLLEEHFSETEVQWFPDPAGRGGVLQIEPEPSDDRYEDGPVKFDSLVAALCTIRSQLEDGDTRPLYLAWLACEFDSEMCEPPVPAGLQALTPALQRLADFLEIPDELIEAAAELSPPFHSSGPPELPVTTWLDQLPPAGLREHLLRVLKDDTGTVRRELLRQVREVLKIDPWPVAESARTRGQLDDAAMVVKERRKRQEIAQQAAERQVRLAAMAAESDATAKKIKDFVATRQTVNYEAAALLLSELRNALGPAKGPAFTAQIAADLRKNYPNARTLKAALKAYGF